MAEGGDSTMMEGFLCPICKGDFGTAKKLMTHFQEEHSDEPDLLKSFKDLFGKAKKKILNQDEVIDSNNCSSGLQSPSNYIEWEEQEIGTVSSHFQYFEQIRSARLQRLSIPVNQLLIRLDKLLDKMPIDPSKKKAHEQNVVPWLDGRAVPRCPGCAVPFHLARRQHHCRLCGSVLCHDCSLFLPLQAAWKILEKQPPEKVNSNDTSSTLRVCQICLDLLERRQQQKETTLSKRIITQFYERLYEYRKQADSDLEMYLKMYRSLREGESIYNLNDAQTLRIKIIHLAENIDALSGKIAVLGTTNTENPPQGQTLILQKAIKTAATAYLRNHLLTLPTLPTEQELQAIRENKRKEILARMHEEKMRETQTSQPISQISPQKRQQSTETLNNEGVFSVGQGWVPSEQMLHFSSDDPLIQQINIIQNYIKEARKSHKYDEVASLEDNLRELKLECWKKLQQQEEMGNSEENSSSE